MALSPYMSHIRAKIGTDLLLTPAAGVALFDGEGRLLLARHVDDGHWGTPGGGVEPGESPRDAAVREFEEEVGLRVENCELIGAYGGPEFLIRYPSGDLTAYVVIWYGCRGANGTVALQADELQEVGWFSEAEAMELDLSREMRLMVPDAFRWWRRGQPGPQKRGARLSR
jgi:8-oxo-dGTP pyrophosphatase MutT (NUDIX family)